MRPFPNQDTRKDHASEKRRWWRMHAISQGAAGCPGATPCINSGSRRSAAASRIFETSRAPINFCLDGTGDERRAILGRSTLQTLPNQSSHRERSIPLRRSPTDARRRKRGHAAWAVLVAEGPEPQSTASGRETRRTGSELTPVAIPKPTRTRQGWNDSIKYHRILLYQDEEKRVIPCPEAYCVSSPYLSSQQSGR